MELPSFKFSCTNGYLDLQKGIFVPGLPPEIVVTCRYDYQEYSLVSPEVTNTLALFEKLYPGPLKKLWDVLASSLEEGCEKLQLSALSGFLPFMAKVGPKLSIVLWLTFRHYKNIKTKPHLMTYLALEWGCPVTILETIDHFL